ncbi:MAG TPA: RNA 2'-phosphotransferase [Acidobacteriota bacterium]|nr:RNA 2'-phosphotransferase [Acidobacteriota bacterium]
MDEKQRTRLSKYLSKHLRHTPEQLGLVLAPGGWVEVETLLAACARNQMVITREQLDEIVATNNKQRFAFDDTGTRIRANQGHSVEVELQLEPIVPPSVLYHGTGHRTVELILKDGLLKMNRHHVHLSAGIETARMVGSRHGKPVVFEVAAEVMHHNGFVFFCSANGVWLVESVPPQYLTQLNVQAG